MTDAPRGDVVEVDLDDQLRAQRHPLEVPARAPPARIGRAALARLIWREKADEAALLRRGETRAVPDHAEIRAIVKAQNQRADGVGLLAGSPARDDGVDRAYALD